MGEKKQSFESRDFRKAEYLCLVWGLQRVLTRELRRLAALLCRSREAGSGRKLRKI